MKNQKVTFTLLATVALICFGLLAPKAFGVVPPPDGGYPGGNTAEGQNALLSLTTGGFNTAVGYFSLKSNTETSFNTAIGAATLFANVGGGNTAVGTGALLSNTGGGGNTANGAFALFSNTIGLNNNAVGYTALFNHHTGSENNAVGGEALYNDQTGSENNAFGDNALNGNVAGIRNTAVGDAALDHSTGDYNTALGYLAGFAQNTGSNNIYIGDSGAAGESNAIAIGARPSSGTNYTATLIGGIYDTVETARIVYVGSNGHLGTLASSRRYKEEIKSMDKTSEALFELKPVVFRYKQEIDRSHALSFGLIAEDVVEVSPHLVSRDKEGKPQTVRYEAVNAMLLNEFLKEHKKVQKLEATVTQQQKNFEQQQKQIQALTANLQKVSARLAAASPSDGGLEGSRPTLKVAANDP